MAHMVPVVLVRGDGNEALYVDGALRLTSHEISALAALRVLDGQLYAVGTARVCDDWLADTMGGDFPERFGDIPLHAFVLMAYNPPTPCEDCGCFHEAGSC